MARFTLLVAAALVLCHCAAASQYGPFQERNGTTGLRWMSIGDWGCDCPIQYDVAEKMGQIAEVFAPHFITLAGDNFYEDGIQGDAHSPRFQKTFEDVYTAPSLQTKFYVVAGNHDYLGNVTAEIEYSKLSQRWTMPYRWYNQTFPIPGTNKTLLFIFYDSIIWAGPVAGHHDEQPTGPAPEHLPHYDEQKKWFENQLATTDADWIVVTGHYPVYSVAEHGPTLVLIESLLPLLEQAGVAVYLNGHDHNTQHIISRNVSFFVTGNGGKNDPNQKHINSVPKDSLKFFQSDGGFLALTFADTTFTSEFWAHNGTVTYSYTGTNPRDTQEFQEKRRKAHKN